MSREDVSTFLIPLPRPKNNLGFVVAEPIYGYRKSFEIA